MRRPPRPAQKSAKETIKTTHSTRKRPSRAVRNKKSKYFDPPTDDGEFDDNAGPSEPEYDEQPKKNPARKKPTKPTPQKGKQKTEESEDEEPWETFVPKEDTPDAGDVEYKNDTIHPNTLQFLRDLAQNNEREWFWAHEKRYRRSENDFKTFIEGLSEKLMEIDPTIPPLPLKDIIFRIYRDVRFSNDKTLYKNHLSAAWSRTGRKGPYAAYYLHLQPNGRSFIAGGKWHPDAGHLARIRYVIDRRPNKFKKPLLKPRFKKLFGGVDGLLKAEDRLKTAPKGYPKDHPDIELLKLKTFHVSSRFFKDEEVTSEGFLELCADTCTGMSEFIGMLNNIVMPDGDDSSSEEE